jgi:hypothetical protein
MRQLRNLALLTAAVACGLGGCNDSTVNVGNDNPTGVVGGVVVDASNEMPLAGVTVQVVSAAATLTAMSDMNGVFQVQKVPAGSFIVTFSQMGYQSATFSDLLAGAVGNFPVKNPTRTLGPIGLVKNDGTFSVRLVDENGAPAPMVKVVARTQVRYVDFSSGGPQAIGATSMSATSDMSGLVTFMGLPDYASLGGIVSDLVWIDVAPVKVMGAEIYTFLGGSFPFNVEHLAGGSPTILLAGPRTPLSVLDSTIDFLRTGPPFGTSSGSEIAPGGPITITFNQAIDPATLRATFLNDDGSISTVQASATPQSNLVSITPSMPFAAGARMNLQIHAATPSGFEYDMTAPFWVMPPSGSKPATVVSGALAPRIDPNSPPTTLVFELSEPIGLGRGASGALNCVAYYEGANFDNNNGPFPGNWTVNGQTGVPSALTCNYPAGTGAALNVTQIVPLETPVAGVGYTGFASRWRVQYDIPAPSTGGCSSALVMTPCQRPASGTKIHLVFSKLDPNSTVRRVSGQPVDDSVVVVIP